MAKSDQSSLHAADQKFCAGCGAKMHKQANACPKCGLPSHHGHHASVSKDKVVAGLLALFLGGIGVHKFYLGQTGRGILYLLFCWTFIPGIIAFVEAIIYFTASPEKWRRIANS